MIIVIKCGVQVERERQNHSLCSGTTLAVVLSGEINDLGIQSLFCSLNNPELLQNLRFFPQTTQTFSSEQFPFWTRLQLDGEDDHKVLLSQSHWLSGARTHQSILVPDTTIRTGMPSTFIPFTHCQCNMIRLIFNKERNLTNEALRYVNVQVFKALDLTRLVSGGIKADMAHLGLDGQH